MTSLLFPVGLGAVLTFVTPPPGGGGGRIVHTGGGLTPTLLEKVGWKAPPTPQPRTESSTGSQFRSRVWFAETHLNVRSMFDPMRPHTASSQYFAHFDLYIYLYSFFTDTDLEAVSCISSLFTV